MTLETVERPITSAEVKLSKYSDLWTRVLETVKTKQAVRVSGLTFKEIRCIRENFRYRLDHYRFRGVMNNSDLTCWLEPIQAGRVE